MTTNGMPKPAEDALGLVGHFNFDKWRKLTELAIQEGEKRLAQALEAINEAQDAVLQRQRELDVLRRALGLQVDPDPPAAPPPPPSLPVPVSTPAAGVTVVPPPPLKQGTRDGNGIGYRAGMYLLEVIRVRGDETISRSQAALACSGWKPGTIRDGLNRLRWDGLLERYGRGLYRLTQAGRDLCADGPVPTVLLPLSDPGRDEAEEKFSAGEPRPVAEWVRERVVVEYGKDEAATLVPHPEENGALARR